MTSETWIALFLLLTAAAYLAYGFVYAFRTFVLEPEFAITGILYIIGAIFFLIYGYVNYFYIAHGKGSTHLDFLDKSTNQGKYQTAGPNVRIVYA